MGVSQTPVVGELAFLSANRFIVKTGLNAENPKPLPDEFIDRIYSHMDRGQARVVLKLYRSARDMKAVLAPLLERMPLIADRPTLVVFGTADAYLPARVADSQRERFPCGDVHLLHKVCIRPRHHARIGVSVALVTGPERVHRLIG